MLTPGTRLGPYEIAAIVGAGGMGEVYRAKDTQLDRDVAIKVLPASFALDADRIARFTREAKTLAALNHPNIAGIYAIVDVPGERGSHMSALVMELVEGEDLSVHIARGPMPLDEVRPIARQIAEALEAAHDQGIIHRDLKPANIKVRTDGVVKVLDFGLAKALGPDGSSSAPEVMNSPTLTARATQMGLVLGTAAYMSPEQAKGRSVDKRADIWAFGAVLYEMLTGTRPFQGDDVSDTLASVLRDTPSMNALPEGTPNEITRLIERCLQRDVKARLRDIGEARIVLDGTAATRPVSGIAAPAVAAPAAASSRWPWLAAGVAGGALLATLAAFAAWNRPDAVRADTVRFTIPLPPGEEITSLPRHHTRRSDRGLHRPARNRRAATLPAGSALVRGPRCRWFKRRAAAVFLSGWEVGGVFRTGATPQSRGHRRRTRQAGRSLVSLRRYVERRQHDHLRRVARLRAPPYSRDRRHGRIAHETRRRRARVRPRVSPVAPRRTRCAVHDVGTQPGLRAALTGFETIGSGPAGCGLRLLHIPVNGRFHRSHPDRRSGGRYPGRAVRRRPPGAHERRYVDPRQRVPDVETESRGWLAVSNTGTAVYATGNPARTSLVWVDHGGKVEPVSKDQDVYREAAVSPDGTRAAVRDWLDLWIHDLQRGTRSRLTSGTGSNIMPLWSHDGARIVFASNRGGDWDIYAQPVDGSQPAEPLLKRPRDQFPLSMLDDGTLLYTEIDPKTGRDLWILSPDGKTSPVRVTPFNETGGQFSPGAASAPRWLAYSSDESGRTEVYVQSYPSGAHRIPVSTHGGMLPVWSPDGRELTYVTGDALVAVAMRPDGSFGEPRPLFDRSNILFNHRFHSYSVSRDGTRFLMIQRDPGAVPRQLNVILNW